MINCPNDTLNIIAKYINLFEGKISNNNRDMSNLANTVDSHFGKIYANFRV